MTLTWLVKTATEMNSSSCFMDSLLIPVSQYSHRLHIEAVEPCDQREHRNPSKEQTEVVQPEGNHQEYSCKSSRLDSAVKVGDPRVPFGRLKWFLSFCSVIRSSDLQEAPGREKVILPTMKLNCFSNHSTSYVIKNTTGELFTYTPSGKVRISTWVKTNLDLPNIPDMHDSFTEGDGLCSQISSASGYQTAGGVAFLLTGHWTL